MAEDNFERAGRSCIQCLRTRRNVDSDIIFVSGMSMGSFWATQVVAYNYEYLKATAVAVPCFEPVHKTMLNSASPSFKICHMFMTDINDEEKFYNFSSMLSLGIW